MRKTSLSLSPFRWGIIGPGRIAHRFAQDLQAVEGAKLVAVASRSLDRAETFARAYGGAVAYASDEALAADPNVDAVYISTPHRFHHHQTRLCLEAGKPVLCEKPFTVNAREAEDLIRLARSKGLFLMEALWSRFLPVHRQVRAWLDEGAIGTIHLVTSTFGFRPPRDPEDRKFAHDLAGGALLDLGVYNISLSQWVLRANPVSVAAHGLSGDTGVDDLTAATMTYPAGEISQFACSFLFPAVNDMTIYGTKGYVRVDPKFWESTGASLVVAEEEKKEVVQLPFRSNGFEYQIEEAMRGIREGRGESEGIPLADTLATMRTMDEIRRQIGLRYTFE